MNKLTLAKILLALISLSLVVTAFPTSFTNQELKHAEKVINYEFSNYCSSSSYKLTYTSSAYVVSCQVPATSYSSVQTLSCSCGAGEQACFSTLDWDCEAS